MTMTSKASSFKVSGHELISIVILGRRVHSSTFHLHFLQRYDASEELERAGSTANSSLGTGLEVSTSHCSASYTHSCSSKPGFTLEHSRHQSRDADFHSDQVASRYVKDAPKSCRGRCGETFRRGRLCECDPQCIQFNTCCHDHQQHCGNGRQPQTNTLCRCSPQQAAACSEAGSVRSAIENTTSSMK
ncbi:Proteoglycan 4 [Liparis tanakae]|uniref:Proteoglycan 4 n=1 Tax=Liparis tanakae TaxID=230148 RepID=A0A4Z2GRX1_9TELE|nr:Proteoglycan 4 [Liparis tanakae]